MEATSSSNKGKPVLLKTPKGTRDWAGQNLVLREEICEKITAIFKIHGGSPLDTPVFELREILAGKYGEEAPKLVYDLADQGGELCSLRYDLTVPFARWLAAKKVSQIKRYQIAKVYRRDAPSRGRFREFWQCDFDIAGANYDAMVPDAEVLCVVAEVFRKLDIDVSVKINHRRILDGLFAAAGVPGDKTRAISSAVDKLDKMSWADVRREMVHEKGLSEEVADRVGDYVRRSGPLDEMLEALKTDEKLCANEEVKAGLADLALLSSYLGAMGVADSVVFDLALARGLDYYTGLIYEAVVTTSEESAKGGEASGVGSIAAGGRYDNLVGMYTKQPIPCVGVSFGIDRIFTVLDARTPKGSPWADVVAREIDVYVMAFAGSGGGVRKEFDGMLLERMEVAKMLWQAGIKAEYSAKVKPSPRQQFNAAKDVPFAVCLVTEELDSGSVRVKTLLEVGGGGEEGTAASGGDRRNDKDPGKLITMENLVGAVTMLILERKGGGVVKMD